MKSFLNKFRQLYTLLFILSAHSLVSMFSQEDFSRDPQLNRQEKPSDFRKYSFLESDQKDTENKPVFRLKFTRYRKPQIFSQPLETDIKKPVRLISKQENDNREQISPMIEIVLGAGALGAGGTAGAAAAGTGAVAGAGVGTGIGAGIGAIATGPALPIIGAAILAGLIINEFFNNNVEDNSGGGGGGGKDPDKDKKEALERQRLEQIKQAQVTEAEKIRVVKETQERQRLEQIRQAEVIEEQRVQKEKEEQKLQRLEQVPYIQTLEDCLIFQPNNHDELIAKLHSCIQTPGITQSESSPLILINEINHQTEKNKAVAHIVFIPGIYVGIGAPAAGGIGGLLTGPVIPVIVVGGVGIKWIISVIKGKIEAKAKKNSGSGGGGDNPDPEKDPKKDKDKDQYTGKAQSEHPNGIAEDNPKHHQNSQGNISKPPRDVQQALDTSRAVPGEKYRVSIEDKKFVILREHSPGRWHGYLIENYKDLIQSERNAFYNTGLTRNIKSGKLAK